jgi:hypothetical protein
MIEIASDTERESRKSVMGKEKKLVNGRVGKWDGGKIIRRSILT